jgi:hypothetical protein
MFQNRGGGNCGPPPVQQWEISLTKFPNAASAPRMLSTEVGGVEGSAWLTQDKPGLATRPDTITLVPLIPQDTDELGRQDVVRQVDDPRNVFLGISDRARLQIATCLGSDAVQVKRELVLKMPQAQVCPSGRRVEGHAIPRCGRRPQRAI